MTKFNSINDKYNLDIILLFIQFLTLPVAHVNAIQNISLILFILVYLLTNFHINLLKELMTIKFLLYIIFGIFLLALLSIHYSLNSLETLKAIKGGLIKSVTILIFLFFFILSSNENKIKYLFFVIGLSLFIHTAINLSTWAIHGFWPFRAGGLLDNGGGERFGIWATYAFSFSIAMFCTKYKKDAIIFLILSIVSIIANNTRATFVGLILIFICYFIFINKNKILKYSIITIFPIAMITFVLFSKNFDSRYDAYRLINSIEYLNKYPPSKYNNLVKKYKMNLSVVERLAMWKSEILYRLQDPFTPQGYGRFLYGKSIVKIWKNKKENIPFRVFKQLHNSFFSMLHSLGIIGLILFILFLGYNLKISYFIISKGNKYKSFSIFIFLGTIGFIASMMFGSFFGGSEGIFFYMLYGILLGLYVKLKNSNEYKIYKSQ